MSRATVPRRVDKLEVSAYRIPTDRPESDGTLQWDGTTMVLVELESGGVRGLGYTYASAAAGRVIRDVLGDKVVGADPLANGRVWHDMVHALRNQGRPGVSSSAVSAVDVAFWDLKAKLLQVPLADLLGRVRDGVEAYGSGGFTSYTLQELQEQLGGWASEGLRQVKMKVGREPGRDPERVRAAREAVGDNVGLFVDANGAYSCKQALALAESFADLGVTWFEEPVSSDDLDGLHLLRDRGPTGMDISAGEYGYDLPYFRRMLAAGAVDVLQADATRCGGITGFLQAATVADAFGVPFSAHCAPALHLPAACAAPGLRHMEYFHDHVRIDAMLFDGAPRPQDGKLYPDPSRPGLGLEFKRQDAQKYAV